MAHGPPLSFRVKEWIQVPAHGWAALVYPKTEISEEETKLLWRGNTVRLDMEDYKVIAVERFAVPYPAWLYKGIGIYIEGEPKNRWDRSQS